MLLGEKLVWDLTEISENSDSLLPPQPSPCPVLLPKGLWLKISSHFGSQGKCEVGLDCLEFSSLQTVWVSEVPSFLKEGWWACPTNPGGHSLGSRDSNDLIPVKGVGSERPERLVGDILGRRTGGLPRAGMLGWSFAGIHTILGLSPDCHLSPTGTNLGEFPTIQLPLEIQTTALESTTSFPSHFK